MCIIGQKQELKFTLLARIDDGDEGFENDDRDTLLPIHCAQIGGGLNLVPWTRRKDFVFIRPPGVE